MSDRFREMYRSLSEHVTFPPARLSVCDSCDRGYVEPDERRYTFCPYCAFHVDAFSDLGSGGTA